MMRAAACLIVKNEASDIVEWAIHHHLIGFDALIVYDHQSSDGTRAVLAALSATTPILLHDWADQSSERQNAAYRDCLARHGHDFEWIGFLDADEFLIGPPGQTLPDLLRQHDGAAGIVVNWAIFGTAGHTTLETGSVMRSLTRRGPYDFGVNRHVKSIVRPSAVKSVLNPHAFDLNGNTVHTDGTKVAWDSPGLVAAGTAQHDSWRVHHYFLRSAAHWERRLNRGQLGADTRHAAQFAIYDRNDVEDLTALPYAAAVAGFYPTMLAALDGHLLCVVDGITNGDATGWAFNRATPGTAVTFTASIDGRNVRDVACHDSRADLIQAGYPEQSGFRFTIPERYRDGMQHVLEFQIGGVAFGIHRDGKCCRSLQFTLHG